MSATSDGGFIVAGYAQNALTTADDASATKFDSEANIEWVGIYTTPNSDYASSVAQLNDGGYLLSGDYWLSGFFRTVMLKINSTGQKQWVKYSEARVLVIQTERQSFKVRNHEDRFTSEAIRPRNLE